MLTTHPLGGGVVANHGVGVEEAGREGEEAVKWRGKRDYEKYYGVITRKEYQYVTILRFEQLKGASNTIFNWEHYGRRL